MQGDDRVYAGILSRQIVASAGRDGDQVNYREIAESEKLRVRGEYIRQSISKINTIFRVLSRISAI